MGGAALHTAAERPRCSLCTSPLNRRDNGEWVCTQPACARFEEVQHA